MANFDADEHKRHLAFIDTIPNFGQPKNDAESQEIRTAPLFTTKVRAAIKNREVGPERLGEPADIFPQYGLLGLRQGTYNREGHRTATINTEENMVYANMNAPWSAFICGSQGGGKSHTLSCLLENCLLSPSPVGVLPNPLAGLVFHYDKFTSAATTQLCEAAYLCSSGVPVRVLVSPSNYHNMSRLYSNLPGLPPHGRRPKVAPLYLQEQQLNISNMLTLMAVSDGSKSAPLYLEVLFQILRDMAIERQGRPGVDYREFKARLDDAAFTRDQNGPLKLRLQLLESFLDPKANRDHALSSNPSSNIWNFEPGSLTIVDLSDPFSRQGGRIVALDEAHKFLTQSGEALNFTEDLVSIIRQQRHLATRVLIATQEPTLSPALIDLCNVTVVHRFLSPAWFETLKKHLAGARSTGSNDSSSVSDIFRTIVGLQTGEALLFSPTALLDIGVQDLTRPFARRPLEKLTDSYIKLRIRKRVTTDGGKSIMASDAMPAPMLHPKSDSGDSTNNSSQNSDSEVEVVSLPSSRFGRVADPKSRDRPKGHVQSQQSAPQPLKHLPQPGQAQSQQSKHNPQAIQPQPKHTTQPVHSQPQQLNLSSKHNSLPAQPQQPKHNSLPAQPQPQSQQPKHQSQPTQPQSQQSPIPQSQSSKKVKKVLQQATPPAQSQPQQGPQQFTKKQKKALKQMAAASG
ncbi:hypothetical protein EPUS_05362 [Endocarpon pusillum Z07020]|uniref:Zona occludens toxin N-terminal domain-containing protein n=1 Tax=Endocarpon pusillum (strain Z07020 / HMAS-L-300199) TaxID=1263415 RepID=U1HWZ2_ENDPU|nr:uncharacterized protein EPUS_05362 [Endocarpon pusillum Z07020]ERF73939.1 hypothetical protein EPUS_05362 [Endocarpon pusillum Z07020]